MTTHLRTAPREPRTVEGVDPFTPPILEPITPADIAHNRAIGDAIAAVDPHWNRPLDAWRRTKETAA